MHLPEQNLTKDNVTSSVQQWSYALLFSSTCVGKVIAVMLAYQCGAFSTI